MLRFDIKDKRHFASDPETGAIFGLTYPPSPDELLGIYIVKDVEHKTAIVIEPGAHLPEGYFEPTRLRFNCGGMYFGLGKLLSSDVKRNSALVRYIVLSLAHIHRERPLLPNAVFCSDFEAFRRALAAKGKSPLFEMPTDEELLKASTPSEAYRLAAMLARMNVSDSPTLYLLCGKIGAGKSTLARRLAARPGTLLISEDHWTSTLFADDLKTIEDYTRYSARLRAAMTPHVVAILGQGLSVVLDFPANTVRQREWMRTLIDEAKVAHEFHLLDVPDAVCLKRLRERNRSGAHPFQVSDAEFDQFTRYFVPPRPDEGFNVVVHKS